MSYLLLLGNTMLDKCGTYLISNEGYISEDIFIAMGNFSMVVVDGTVKEEKEYIGRLYGSLSGTGSDFIIIVTLVLIYCSNLSFIVLGVHLVEYVVIVYQLTD